MCVSKELFCKIPKFQSKFNMFRKVPEIKMCFCACVEKFKNLWCGFQANIFFFGYFKFLNFKYEIHCSNLHSMHLLNLQYAYAYTCVYWNL